MANKRNKKRRTRPDNWRLPKNARDYFNPHYDDDFKSRHPVLYWLTVIAIFVLVLVGPLVYLYLCSCTLIFESLSAFQLIVWIVGFVSSFGISIGICNLFMIIHDQYLGHYVTLYSFIIGFAVPAVSLMILN